MKSNGNRYLKTQMSIVKTLLDGSKKTQNQIAKETNYEKSTISHALDDLEKKEIIRRESKKKESGNRNKGNYTNKLCWLTYEINNGSQIMQFLRGNLKTLKQEEKEDFFETLQKNEMIVSMVADKQNLFAKHPPDSSELETAIKMLTLSRSFFHDYVLNPNFLDVFSDLWSEAHREETKKFNISLGSKARTPYNDGECFTYRCSSVKFEILFNAFEHSLITDKIENVYIPESLDYFQTLPDPKDTESYYLVGMGSPPITAQSTFRHQGFYSLKKDKQF